MSFNRKFNKLPRIIRVVVVFFIAYISSSLILLWFFPSEYVGFLVMLMFFVSAYFAIKITGRPQYRHDNRRYRGYRHQEPRKVHVYHHDVHKEKKEFGDSIRYGGKRMMGGGLADASRELSKRWGKRK